MTEPGKLPEPAPKNWTSPAPPISIVSRAQKLLCVKSRCMNHPASSQAPVQSLTMSQRLSMNLQRRTQKSLCTLAPTPPAFTWMFQRLRANTHASIALSRTVWLPPVTTFRLNVQSTIVSRSATGSESVSEP